MEEVEGGGLRLGGKGKEGEVDYRTKSGTAWSHSYLNQKPWHPLSYPNQRRKWIAEQTTANRQRRSEEVAREFAQEQEFFRQTALISKKEKEKVEMMKAVSFMYVRPPGYNAESAKAAEVADERKKSDENSAAQESTTTMVDAGSDKGQSGRDKKSRPKDVFGRSLPTEEEFEVLKNAPRLETGMPGRAKPFGIEIRNVRCVRCAAFGHQSGDRECPLKDAIMPNEENRLKRDDPLTTIMAQTDSCEPLKWELKQKPGMSPPRGGFQPDDPNQQIVADEIFDEYGGFLSGGDIPMLLTNFSENKSAKHCKSKSKHRHRSSRAACSEPKNHHRNLSSSPYDSEIDRVTKRRVKSRHKKKKVRHAESTISDNSELGHRGNQSSSSDSVVDRERKRRAKGHHVESNRSGGTDLGRHRDKSVSSDSEVDTTRKMRAKGCHKESNRSGGTDLGCHRDKSISSDSEVDTTRKRRAKGCHKESNRYDNSDLRHRSVSSDFEVDMTRKRGAKGRHKESNRYESSNLGCQRHGSTSSDSEVDRTRKGRERGRHKESNRYNSSDLGRQRRGSISSDSEVDRTRKGREKGRHKESNRYNSSDLGRQRDRSLSSDSEVDRTRKKRAKGRQKESNRYDSSDLGRRHGDQSSSDSDADRARERRRENRHNKKKKSHQSDSSASEKSDSDYHHQNRRKHRHC